MASFLQSVRAFAALLLCLACAPAAAQLAVQAPEPLRRLLLAHLSADSGAERLREEAAQLLATEGYFRPGIEVRPAEKGLLLRVDPGPRAEVTSVAIEFEGDLAREGPARADRRRALREAWTLREGRPFRDADWREAKQELLRRLTAEDYAGGRLADSEARVEADTGQVRLRIVADSGPPFVFGPLEIRGLERYGPDLVRRFSTITEGERYSREQVLALQAALQNTAYFGSVLVDVDPETEQGGALPVRVTLRERRTKRVGLSAGYSSNTGFRGEVTYEDRNLLDRGWHLASGLRLEQRRRFAYADVFLPPTAKEYRDSFGALYERDDTQGLVVTRQALAAVRSRQGERIETRLSLNFQRERRTVGGVAEPYLTALAPNWSWTYRDVDDLLDPRRGYTLNVQLGGATKLLLSDQNFVRLYSRFQRFQPVGERDVLLLRAEAGLTIAPERRGVPESFLFRAGGAQSVRGYQYNALGVREQGAVVGGRRLVVGSIEYVHWLASPSNWGGAVFYDVGNAGDSRDDFKLRVGYGAGLRWRSPVGPLALDLAYGHADRRFRPHFSVSVAF